MHMMSRQDRSAVAAQETIGLLRRVRTLAVQQTPARNTAVRNLPDSPAEAAPAGLRRSLC